MPIPAVVQDAINQIISATEDVSPELRQPMADELQEQFEVLLQRAIRKQLTAAQAITFNQLIDEQADATSIQQFLDEHLIDKDINGYISQAAEQLKQLYLGKL
jgi:hypothetical protein